MNALVGIRANATGLLSPTAADRLAVHSKLLAQGAPAQVPKTQGASAPALPGQELGRDAFLRLLVLQLQHQDPLEPVDNEAMLAQLAQFTALEQMNNLNESFETLSGNVDQLNFISASQLLGRTVRGIDLEGNPTEGTVESVHLDGSIVVLRVGERLMSMAGVFEIDSPVQAE